MIAFGGFRVLMHDEDPQRGSAFSMFATSDIGATRRVLVAVPGEDAIDLNIPDVAEQARARLADAPSERRARHLADLLLALTWDVEGEQATAGGEVTLDHVRIRVVGLEARNMTVSRRTILDVVVEATGS